MLQSCCFVGLSFCQVRFFDPKFYFSSSFSKKQLVLQCCRDSAFLVRFLSEQLFFLQSNILFFFSLNRSRASNAAELLLCLVKFLSDPVFSSIQFFFFSSSNAAGLLPAPCLYKQQRLLLYNTDNLLSFFCKCIFQFVSIFCSLCSYTAMCSKVFQS